MLQESPSSLLRVGYLDTEVEIASESVLYDLVTMLSSVGGSLGLFLGFSFLDCGLAAIEWAWKEKKATSS